MVKQGHNTKKLQFQDLKTNLQLYLDKPLAKGDAWFLIDSHWFKQLQKYVGMKDTPSLDWGEDVICDSGGDEAVYNRANPGPINNKPLFKENGSGIRDHMIEGLDYVLIPEDIWTLLTTKFGLSEPQKPVKRKVVARGMYIKHYKLEVYPNKVQQQQKKTNTNTNC